MISTNDCWLWARHISPSGYGQMFNGGKVTSAHRVLWEIYNNRQAPRDMVVDHLCRVRHCINPDHLELVTQKVNIARAVNHAAGLNGKKTHCLNGHEFTAENTVVYYGKRRCRICHRARTKEHVRQYRARQTH